MVIIRNFSFDKCDWKIMGKHFCAFYLETGFTSKKRHIGVEPPVQSVVN